MLIKIMATAADTSPIFIDTNHIYAIGCNDLGIVTATTMTGRRIHFPGCPIDRVARSLGWTGRTVQIDEMVEIPLELAD